MSSFPVHHEAGKQQAQRGGPVFADSHAHLDYPDFSGDLDAVMQRAGAAGVRWINTIATRLTAVPSLLAIAERFPGVSVSVGTHPHYAGEGVAGHPAHERNDASAGGGVAAIVAAASHAHVVAVGETGLDFHYNFSEKEQQEAAFRDHIHAAKVLDLPLIIHTREAEEATRRIIEAEGLPPRGGVLHCFTGSLEMGQWGIAQGLHLSFSGVLTFKNADALRDVARHIPLESLLIETDAPYLAPLPMRGKRNEPAWVVRVAETLAQVRGISVEQVAEVTTANYERFLRPTGLAQGDGTPSVVTGQPTLAYAIGSGLYLNISRGCSLRCHFCPKWVAPIVHQYDLTLTRNPSAAEVLAAMGDFSAYQEIVFCGYGEPTLALQTLLTVAREIKKQSSIPIRINTDGLANRVYRRDITPQFKGLIDAVSVSLNAQNEEVYQRHTLPSLPGSYAAVLDFLRCVQAHVPSVTATAVEGLEGVDMEACRQIAEGLGVRFRKRFLNRLG
ncbi:MAG: YchF/TatD family DNA exonuclease [Magnetococcales bacterium]|nr:YchF/TatD family DNA exonuclease [Magnetococcales bacterium]